MEGKYKVTIQMLVCVNVWIQWLAFYGWRAYGICPYCRLMQSLMEDKR
jgi:hypothetical protein